MSFDFGELSVRKTPSLCLSRMALNLIPLSAFFLREIDSKQ
jgi:hypothetical protein